MERREALLALVGWRDELSELRASLDKRDKVSIYRFSPNERHAVYTAHKEKCYMCSAPIDLQTMQIDHVIPESLLDDPARLGDVLREFGLNSTFDLNSPENWLPACPPCNSLKADTVFDPTPLIQLHLKRAREKTGRVFELIEKSLRRSQITKALNLLQRAGANGELTDEHKEILEPLVVFQVKVREPELATAPVKLTPLYTVLQEDSSSLAIKGPYGVGRRPKGDHIDPSWNCINCGSIAAWNGARCVICGMMDCD